MDFAYALAGSLIVLVPGLSHVALGVAEAVLVVALLMLMVNVVWPRWRRERDLPANWRVGHAVPGAALTMLAAVAAVATITRSIGGLYWLGGAMALATVAGLSNSWVLLVEIKR